MSNHEQQVEEQPQVEVAPVHVLSLITKAEIDMQIATAKAFPRSLTQFQRKVMSMATINPDVAESCNYTLPRAGKNISGPSVRLAEIVAASYTNLRTGARVVFMDDKKIVAQGVVHDLENNIYHTEEVERRITNKKGETYSEDMKIVAGRAACAIAYRNAIFKVVPAALIQDVYDKVLEVAKGTAETLVSRRDKRVNYFRTLGVKDEQICQALGVKEINDIDLDKLQVLQGMVTALKNQEATLDGLFPTDTGKDKANAATKSTEDKLKKRKDGNGVKSTEEKLQGGAPGAEGGPTE